MKLLGIDYGTKRIGLAVSDESFTLARELNILSPKEFFDQINSLVAEHEVSGIVLGLPLNMDGQDSDKTREARAFASQLEGLVKVPVHMMDERLSSVMAEALPGGRANTDSLAAQIILQNYLDKNRNT